MIRTPVDPAKPGNRGDVEHRLVRCLHHPRRIVIGATGQRHQMRPHGERRQCVGEDQEGEGSLP